MKTEPSLQFKPNLKLALLALSIIGMAGCARFSTTQIDERFNEETKEKTTVTTQASAFTFFDSNSTLATWKAEQSEESQSAEVGGLDQTSLSPPPELIESVTRGIMKRLNPAPRTAMIPFFLQVPAVTTSVFTNTALSALAIVVCLERIISFYKNHMKEQPVPGKTNATRNTHNDFRDETLRQISRLEEGAEKMESEFSAGLEKIRDELKVDRNSLDKDNDARASRLHKRIDPLAGLARCGYARYYFDLTTAIGDVKTTEHTENPVQQSRNQIRTSVGRA